MSKTKAGLRNTLGRNKCLQSQFNSRDITEAFKLPRRNLSFSNMFCFRSQFNFLLLAFYFVNPEKGLQFNQLRIHETSLSLLASNKNSPRRRIRENLFKFFPKNSAFYAFIQ